MTVSRRTMLAVSVGLGAATMATPLAASKAAVGRTERWGVFELKFDGPRDGNPFDDVTLSASFSCDGKVIRVPGFYDGDGVYRIRFSPPEMGRWQWTSRSSASAMDGQQGSFNCVAPSAGNHGPVRVAGGYHFAYADGTPFRQIGTTSYSWALQSEALCARTLATLNPDYS